MPAQTECSLNGAVVWLWGASLRQYKKCWNPRKPVLPSRQLVILHMAQSCYNVLFGYIWFNLKPIETYWNILKHIETLNMGVHRFILFLQLCLRPPPPPQPQATLAIWGCFWWLRMSQFAKRLKDPKGPKVFLRWIGLNRMVQYDSIWFNSGFKASSLLGEEWHSVLCLCLAITALKDIAVMISRNIWDV